MRKPHSTITLYLSLTAAFSSIFWALIIVRGSMKGGLYTPCLMWCPALAALVTIRVQRIGLRSLGLRWGGAKFAALGYFTPLAYAAIAYGLIWMLRFGQFPDPQAVTAIGKQLGWAGSGSALVLIYLARTATVQVLFALTTALGEEIGWRGLLTPSMLQRFGFAWGSVFVGLIWAAWHMPLLLFADYNTGTPWWFSIPCFCALTIGISVILSWLRQASASVWPCAILHASHNAFIQFFFTPLTKPTGAATAYVIDEFGIAVPFIAALFALAFWLGRGRLAPGEPTASPSTA